MAIAATVFRDYETDGVPASGAHKVKKSSARELLTGYEAIINAFTSNGGLIYTSKAAMDADLAHDANSSAWVVGDATVANNGIYQKQGASGTGSWTRVADLPFSFIIASDAGAGTANAIVATTSIPVISSALVWMNVFEANTSSPVTVAFNGGSALTIKTNSGNDVASGGLTAGMIVLGIVSGSTFRLVSDQSSAALVAAAEAAQAAAEAAAVSVNIKNVADRTALKALDTTVTTLAFVGGVSGGLFKWTTGDFSAHITADTEEGIYAKADAIASTVGAWVRVYSGYPSARWFGLVSYTQAALVALNGDASIDTQATANADAIDCADAVLTLLGGGRFTIPEGITVTNRRYERSSSVYIVGVDVGEWEPTYNSVRDKTWEGSTLLFKGTGTADLTFDGVTSAEHGGGWREDPDNLGTYFKLWTGYNSDATGTTPATQKTFSAGILVKENVRYGGIRNLRLCNWNGTDGISDWSDPATSSLGDDWDFGYLIRNGEYTDDDNIQVVGGWREAAHGLVTTAISASTGERNHVRRAKFQGVRGHIIRAPDRWDVTSATANSITIRWSSELFFASGGGSFRGSDNVTYTYTGVTHAGSDAAYVFTGVTPDPSSITQIRFASTGMANTEYEDVITYGLDHVSDDLASVLGFAQSEGLQVSGFPLRGVKFTNYKVHTDEPVIAHLHDCDDLLFLGPQFEGGGHFIASPQDSAQSWAAAPVGDTQNLVMLGDQGTASCDLELFLPRTGMIQGIQVGQQNNLDGSLVMKPIVSGRKIRILTADEAAGFEMSTAGSFATVGAAQLTVTGSGGNAILNFGSGTTLSIRESTTSRLQITATSGTVRPGADNTQALGGASNRWSEVFAGNGTINTSDERMKRDIDAIGEKVLDAWGDVEWCQYRFTDGVRLHMGLVAQRVQAAFENHGLDGFELGLLCYDEWEDQFEEVHEEREVLIPVSDKNGATGEFKTEKEIVATGEYRLATPAGNRYGLRYEECLAVESAYQRRRMAAIEARLNAGKHRK